MAGKTIWIDDEHWACLAHMREVTLPATASRCWYAGCKSTRPERPSVDAGTLESDARRERRDRHQAFKASMQRLAEAPPWTPPPAPEPPSAPEATEAAPALKARPKVAAVATPLSAEAGDAQCGWAPCDKPARPGSKYCSRNCSNKNARARHKKRAKKDKAA